MTRNEKKELAKEKRNVCKGIFLSILDALKINQLNLGYSEPAARNAAYNSIEKTTDELTKQDPSNSHIYRSLQWELKRELNVGG